MTLLRGIRVIDVSTALAGPYCAMLLADLGADVIKVEKPRRGDLTRFSDRHVAGESGYFLGVNRNKSGMTVDLRRPEGQEIIRQLAPTVDVIIENFRDGMMDSWHMGFDDICQLNPAIIYCSIRAYGSDCVDFPAEIGNDMTVQAYSGLLDLTGEADRPPSRIGPSISDIGTAFQTTNAVLAALYARASATGTPTAEHIEVSLLESGFSLLPNMTVSTLNSDFEFKRSGAGHPQFAPYEAFECSDGRYVIIGSFHNRSWIDLCGVLGRSELVEDSDFKENFSRVQNKERLHTIIGAEIGTRPRDYWVDAFQRADVPCAPILTLRESLTQFRKVKPQLVEQYEHPELGPIDMLRPAYRFLNRGVVHDSRPAPGLGADTDQILTELGFSQERIAELRAQAIV